MRISLVKLNIELARRCKPLSSLRCVVSPQTLTKVRQGEEVSLVSVGRIAKALGVDPAEIVEMEGNQ